MNVFPRGSEWFRLLFTVGFLVLGASWGMSYMMKIPGASYDQTFLKLTSIETQVRDRLKTHVNKLAGDIGERNIWTPKRLEMAAKLIENHLKALNYQVASHEYSIGNQVFRNVEGTLIGKHQPEKIVIVGAHYDTVRGSPGADDNASGVAAMLELATLFQTRKLNHTLRCVGFVNEEPPFFKTKAMGSHQYVTRSKARGEKIRAAIVLESIGYYRGEKGSQHYPFPLGFFYPETGNFLGFVLP